MSRQRNQSGPAESVCDALDAAGQLDTGCKILPFGQAHHRKTSSPGELVHGYMVTDSDNEESLEARKNFLHVCLPEYSEGVSYQGSSWVREEPTGKTSFGAARWLKKVLILSTFTAWTVAAIAIAIALD
jgi:hypothetical protein